MKVPAVRSVPWLLVGGFGVACALGPGIDVPAKGNDGGFESDGPQPSDDFGSGDDSNGMPSGAGGTAAGGTAAGGTAAGGMSALGGSEPSGGMGGQGGVVGPSPG